MENPLNQELNNWGENLSSYKFPRWDELPEIYYYMDQVVEFTTQHLSIFSVEDSGKLISPSIINNYVKQKIIPPPIKKRYSRDHIALLLIICILKPAIPIASIQSLIHIQLKSSSLEELYNHFCDEQEYASQKIIENANKDTSSMKDLSRPYNEILGLLAMRMAIKSNSSKLLTDKLVILSSETLDNPADK
ncbi:MAG: DUF1836 domain-containing protein [Clostridium sp.]